MKQPQYVPAPDPQKRGCNGNVLLAWLVIGLVGVGWIVTSQTHLMKTLPTLPQVLQYVQHQLPATSSPHTTGKPQTTVKLSAPSGPCFDQARAAAKAVGIDPLLYARQINQESGCQGRICSPAGACGAAQLMPEMAKSLGVNPMNVAQSLQAGAHLMAGYLKLYHGNWALALACYNAGTGTVKAVLSYGTAWYTHLPFETQHYIASILGQGGQA
jgi:Transglycosylase SLT domain